MSPPDRSKGEFRSAKHEGSPVSNAPGNALVPAAGAAHPLKELAGRYAAVLGTAWRHRFELTGPARQADEAAFLPAALSLQETPPHPAPRRVALALCALFVLALVWAFVGQVDIVAVAPGRIMVTEGSKLIQPLEAGVVQTILVKDGDPVQAGQRLVELDATAPQADATRLVQQRAAALGEALRTRALLRALATGIPPQLPRFNETPQAGDEGVASNNSGARLPESRLTETQLAQAHTQLAAEWADLQAQRARLRAEAERRAAEAATTQQEIAKVQAMLPLARQREADIQGLSRQGFVAGHAGQDRTRERIELERDLATLQAKRQEAQAGQREAAQQAQAWATDATRQLQDRRAKAELSLAQLQEETVKAEQRQRLTQLTAPVAGTVQQLAVHTAGGVVTPAQVLMVVVPSQAQVTAEVVLDNKDIGFVQPGQAAEIKLETFPYTRWGTVPATVAKVSADAVNDDKRGAIFPVTLVLQQTHLQVDDQRIKLGPGMNLTAEVKTGKRRVIDYLLSPVQRRVSESLRER